MARSITLIDTTGAVFPLTFPYIVGDSPSLWGAPPVRFQDDEWAGAGSVISQVRYGAREAVLPVTIAADSPTEADDALAALLRAVNPIGGTVRVRVTHDDGSARDLAVYAVGGFEGLAYRKAHSSTISVPLRLYAPNPFWRSVNETEAMFIPPTFTTGTGSTRYADDLPYGVALPYTGVTLAGHLTTHLVVTGDAPAWPRFELVGPASSIEMVNHHPASHQGMYFEDVLATNDRLIIETEPGRRLVSVNGVPAFAAMGDGWEWWSLHPGDNEIGINVESFGPTTTLQVSFHEEFLTP